MKIALEAGRGSLALVLVAMAGLCVPLAAQAVAQEGAAAKQLAKKPVSSVMDLPRYTYKIEGKASEFLLTGAPFAIFVS